MKTYRRKFAKKALRDAALSKVESRDAVLWYIDSESSCRVKLQGTDNLVTAHFPRNQRARPRWLRVGNAVRVEHRSGVRGYIEVVGPGRAIPQPIVGSSYPSLPASGGIGDGIISGMVMTENFPPSNGVRVSDGSYRISNTIYYFTGVDGGYIVMDDPPPMVMGEAPIQIMGVSSTPLDPAPSGSGFRYDALVIGNDQAIEYIIGVEASSSPVKPTVPSGKILIDYILRIGGDSIITDELIGIDWTTPAPTEVIVTLADEFPWDEFDDYPEEDLTITVIDQYGHSSAAPTAGWKVSLQKVLGTGKIRAVPKDYEDTETDYTLKGGEHTYSFQYQRNQTITELKPFFIVTVETRPPLHAVEEDMELLLS